MIRGDAGATGPIPSAPLPRQNPGSPDGEPVFDVSRPFTSPVRIASVELLRVEPRLRRIPLLRAHGAETLYFVRTTSTDGATGIAITNERVRHLYPILQELVMPYFVGRDARDLEALIDGVYVHRSNCKLAGLALWCCVGWVEHSILDLLGCTAGKPVAELFGGIARSETPVYLSSLNRERAPEEDVEFLAERVFETGAKRVKFKIGGRMSRNADAREGRMERLVPGTASLCLGNPGR